ncbi:phage tail protein [Klebsiella aerogenes]|uniref:phage tail-collar fiber domain-containing protein n=2 Tax=Klebsiella aerogenes TaxID=548 RepID=UPI0025516CD6|nr:phage tail protein [Klebsiella aerogenes]MDK7098596.1 phage tail protein [Klebsiella aerogenes]MDK7644219.1 phage tail protein [Klebsiella aerogenes]MDK7849309.1 phage tail protein [Klebsiella aerogenes]MDK8311286.1 phage tail protein [Klebsiella aerogenes]
MSAKFYTLLTDIGAAKLASAAALGVPLKITHMAVGDGGGVLPTPSAQQTKLVAEKRRASLNMLYIDPQNSSQIIAEQVIPETEGGWWIREIGLFDETGALIAVGNCPESYKPQLAEGSGRTQTVRMVLITSSTDNITLKIDPAVVLATRQYVDDTAIEVRLYTDEAMKAHLAEANPHPQYLQAKNNLSELTDKSKARGSLELGSAATKDVGTEAGNVIGVGGFGLGADKINTVAIDFKTRVFRAGQSLLLKMESCTNVPDGLPKGPGEYVYAHCLGVRDNSYGCTVIFIAHNSANITFIGTRYNNTNSGWILMRVGNQAELSKYLSLAGGDITGRLGVGGVLQVGKTGTESLITLGASTVMRDNANNALVISSESGAGTKAGVFLRPIASTDSTMQMQGNADGWFTDKFTPKSLKITGTDAINKSGAYSYTDGSQKFNQTDGLFMLGVGEQYGKIRFTEMVGKRAFLGFEIKGGDTTAWVEFRQDGSFVINGTDVSPVGIPQPWPLTSAPLGWLICNGAAFDKAMYPYLAAAYPSSKLPDLRGEFIRGWDAGRGVDAGRAILAAQGDAIRNITGSINGLGGEGGAIYYKSTPAKTSWVHWGGDNTFHDVLSYGFDASRVVPTASENRPRNIAFNYIVRAA